MTLDGTYVSCGFQPALVWIFYGGPTSGDVHYLYSNIFKRANTNTSEVMFFAASDYPGVSSGTYAIMDFTSDGFKLRGSSQDPDGQVNWVYIAFADHPASSSLPTRFNNI